MKRLLVLILLLNFCFGISSAQEKLTLDESVQIALEKSPMMLKTRAEIVAAEGAAGQVVAGFLPQLSVSGGVGKYYAEPQTMIVDMTGTGSPAAISFGIDEQADTSSYKASLNQVLFTGGKLSNSLGMANKGLAIAREELKKTSDQVKFDVINAYYNVLKATKLIELSEQSVAMAQNHLDRVNALLKVGMSTKADTLRGEVQHAQAEISLTKAKQAVEIAKNYFNNTLGVDLDSPVELVDVAYKSKEIPEYNYKDLLKIAYDDRPDWRQYVLIKEISDDEVRLAYSGLWPMISLVGNYDIGTTKYSTYQSDVKNWTALISGSWNIFDGTATWNKIKEAKAKQNAQQADETIVRRTVALEVKDANFMLKSAKENLASTQKAVELAEENYKIADLRYDSGVGTSLEEIDAQVAVTRARVDLVQSQHDLQIAKARINKVVGAEIY
ncbi:MAG: TolC family protein [Candidatus Margulisbacteria bacterium]|nr:TolC family protein [Candidatus Margulisiibacteriota bacterium]